jgi:hypothetical protein
VRGSTASNSGECVDTTLLFIELVAALSGAGRRKPCAAR